MKQEGLRERMELLEIGEKLGWPRLGYGRSTKIPHDKRIPQGKDGWEKFAAHAHVRRIYPALRIGRVLRDNNVEVFHPLTGAETARALNDVPPDLLSDIDPFVSPLDAAVAAIKAVATLEPSVTVVTVSTTPRRKRGGHKKPRRTSS